MSPLNKSVTWQRGIKIVGGIKVADHLNLNVVIILDYLGGPNVITRLLECERGRQKVSARVIPCIKSLPVIAAF